MSSFSVWILSIVGVICLTTLIDILLQEGETKKYVKSICSLLIFSVILTPISIIAGSNGNLKDDSISSNSEVLYEENVNFIYQIKTKNYENIKEKCLNSLSYKGLDGLDMEVILNYDREVEIINIIVDKKSLVIKDEMKNIDIVGIIKNTVADYFELDKEFIEVIN